MNCVERIVRRSALIWTTTLSFGSLIHTSGFSRPVTLQIRKVPNLEGRTLPQEVARSPWRGSGCRSCGLTCRSTAAGACWHRCTAAQSAGAPPPIHFCPYQCPPVDRLVQALGRALWGSVACILRPVGSTYFAKTRPGDHLLASWWVVCQGQQVLRVVPATPSLAPPAA